MGFSSSFTIYNTQFIFLPFNIFFKYYFLKKNDNQFNNANVYYTFNKKDHLNFVETLMTLLNRKYIIKGDFLIDLDRKDYLITTYDNKISIINCNYNINNFIFIFENFFFF